MCVPLVRRVSLFSQAREAIDEMVGALRLVGGDGGVWGGSNGLHCKVSGWQIVFTPKPPPGARWRELGGAVLGATLWLNFDS